MVSLAQRIEALRTERGLSRAELSLALGFPRNAAEKFETGRQTPTQEQQEALSAFFGVSPFYLRGESNDRTRQDNWLSGALSQEEAAPALSPRPVAKSAPAPKVAVGDSPLWDSFMKNKAFQDMIRATVLEVLRSPEGQALLDRAVSHALNKTR